MRIPNFVLALLLVAPLLGASPARSIPITVDGGWVSFNVSATISDGPWTFSAVGPVLLTVIDRYVPGERWAVYDNAIHLGDTSVAPIYLPPTHEISVVNTGLAHGIEAVGRFPAGAFGTGWWWAAPASARRLWLADFRATNLSNHPLPY